MRALTPLCELGVSGSGVGESGSVGRVSSRASRVRFRGAVGGGVKKRFSQKELVRVRGAVGGVVKKRLSQKKLPKKLGGEEWRVVPHLISSNSDRGGG